jgi:NAD(P)-dependent dehydrogenase (short-subunit alcohol dehydrogenase family)
MAWDLRGPEDDDPVVSQHADRFHFYEVDVCSKSSIEAALREGQERFGANLHCIVNNAAIADPYLKDEERESRWKRVIETNLTGGFWQCGFLTS